MRDAVRASNFRCIRSVTEYQSCLVDYGASRSVHCPELNACFLSNCNTVHFGYAIPVSVVPVDENSNLVELVFDIRQNVDPAVASYLLSNHPDFRDIREAVQASLGHSNEDSGVKNMETMAKHDHLRKFTEPEEDIAAIAKQISDHAEAIYQTWKSRGLAPTEILTCHSSETAADKFGSALTPKAPKAGRYKNLPSSVEKLSPSQALDSSNLERFVNTFVVEDKARLAAGKVQAPAQKSRSIQYALQKFEKNSKPSDGPKPFKPIALPTQISRPVPANQIQLQSLDTIEVILPEEIVRKEVTQLPKKVTELERTGALSVPSWPLKKKKVGETKQDPIKKPAKNSDEYLDEVRREEERLINALKCGMIINEETPEVEPEDGVSVADAEGSGIDSNAALKNAASHTISGRNEKKDGGGFSLVSYAKTRYKNAQENPLTQQRLEQSKVFDKFPASRSQVVNAAKTRFELCSGKSCQNELRNRDDGNWLQHDDVDKGKLKGKPRHAESVPHPELTSQQRQHLRQVGSNPIRPFLTRGSVAERVLIFEKCPSELLLDKRRNTPAITAWRSGSDVQSRAQKMIMVNALKARMRRGCYACEFYRVQQELGLVPELGPKPRFPYVPPKQRLPRSYNKTYSKEDKQNQRSTQPLHTTLRRHTKANKNVFIPRFYFPQGKPQSQQQMDQVLQKLAVEFRAFPMGQVPKEKFHVIVKACECPLYWKVPLFIAAGGETLGYVDAHNFLDYWKQLTSTCHDVASRFLTILVKGATRNFLLPEDFIPLIQDVVDTHPGLTFLKEANEFHSRYIHTVIARIFYCVNRSWSGRISLPELRRSNLLQVISLLEDEEDINQITQYFSYEHFYVIYCKFWELDTDHDLFIDRQDLTRHNDHALSSRMIDRIFSGAVTRGTSKAYDDRMSYTEFVWFLLSEEDKQHPTAIEYWFRCMDLDGDGYLSMYELEYFYEEQLQRMELLGIETLPFEDCLCQMLDMIHPQTEGKITLSDLKKCKMVTLFFDTFFNLEKYLDHEQRDPFASQRDLDGDGEISDWDRYAAEEYEILVAEEGGNEHNDEIMYDYLDQSDDELGGPQVCSLKVDGFHSADVPYRINAQIIPVNMESGNLMSSPSSAHENGTRSLQIHVKCSTPDSDSFNDGSKDVSMGTANWDSTCV